MTGQPHRIVMSSPDCYEVCYTINPWMQPDAWDSDRVAAAQRADRQWHALAERLRALDIAIEVVPAAPGLPDIVFPANAAIVLDGRALMARFRHPERRGEEPCFLRFFEALRDRGLITGIHRMPDGVFQEGAGDCLWDARRGLFWSAYGPRSMLAALDQIAKVFNRPVVGLELVTETYYHLDTCFCPLSGGEVVYYPPAFSDTALARIAAHVPHEQRIVATDDEAASFSLNAVNVGRDLVMTQPPPRLAAILAERGYRVLPVDLSSFVLSGGAAFCMTLRLDLSA